MKAMTLKRVILGLTLALALSLTGGLVSAQDAPEIENACLVANEGALLDGTFNEFSLEGLQRAVEDFNLEDQVIDSQAVVEFEDNLNLCVSEGADVVVTVGFQMSDVTFAAAEANPDVYFVGIDQFVFEGPSNYAGVQFREDQAGFLVGALAALATENGIIAGVYGIDIPPVVRYRNGFEQGVAYIAERDGREIEVLGNYNESFTDPAKGASDANQYIGEGADILLGAGGPTGSGAITEAAQQEIYVIGVDQDEYFTTFGSGETPGAEYIITSGIKRVDVGVYDMIAALVEGNMDAFPGGSNYVLTVQNGGMTFVDTPHDSDVPEEVYEQVREIEQMLIDEAIDTGVDPLTGELIGDMGEEDMDMDAEEESDEEADE